jgi:RNA polymerase sigma-70 factor (ECF subfamily)
MSQLRKQFSKIYDKYVDKIYRFIFLKVSSPEIAEDLTSEVFARGWQAYKEKKRDIENVTAFLYQIARNLIVDHYREKARAQFVSVENVQPIADTGVNLEEEALLKSDFNNVKEALANIREDYREVIVWYYLDELKVPEIAKMLDKSEEAVRVLIHRALNALKDELQDSSG